MLLAAGRRRVENTNHMARINFPEMEQQLVQQWQQDRIFERSVQERPEDNQYVFYDGPPFATGLPHYGHILASTLKDVMPRYATMRGYRVERRWGWDCHGLPIENLIEKELGLKTKQDIEAIGVAKFNDACRNNVLKYANEWQAIIHRLGRWVDMEQDYKTMDTTYSESIWWAFKELHSKGLIYEGKKSMHLCPRCETTLSNFEVTQGYKDVTDQTATAAFKLVDEDLFLLAWTTTPWTLPGNVAIAVGAAIEYAVVQADVQDTGTRRYVVAKELVAKVFEDIEHSVESTMLGSELAGKFYEPLFPYFTSEANEHTFQVLAAEFVTTEEGTGMVHIAGGYGQDDYDLVMAHDLPLIQHVGTDGKFVEAVTDFAGQRVKPLGNPKETDQKIVQYLRDNQRLFEEHTFLHSYPHCWRCDTPLLNYASSSWFVQVTALKDHMLEHNATVNWTPHHIKDGRFGKWLEGARDWAISRDRYWGAPIPVWQAEDGDIIVVGSLAELEQLSGQALTDVHKEFVDEVTFEQDGKTYTRVPQVLDCWFESGSMPYAQQHYPFENEAKFNSTFPANFIAEGLDQTRGWFYTLMVLSTALFDKPAFQNVIVNGLVLASDGKKMSKRLKNYPEPGAVMNKYGADALRFYLMSSPVVNGADLKFSEQGVDKVMKRLMLTLWNVFSFYQMFADEGSEAAAIDSQNGTTANVPNIMDTWVLAYMQDVTKRVTKAMEGYQLQVATRTLEEAVQEVSTWYIRRSRDRFKGTQDERVAAVAALQQVLLTLVKLLAPFTPFVAERIYLDIKGVDNQADSVHLETWPQVVESLENAELLEQMQVMRQQVEQLLAMREAASIKVRQPLASVTVPADLKLSDDLKQVLAEEVNVKTVLDGKALALDTTITPELAQEGMFRELVRAINNLRKQQGLTIHDTTIIVYHTESKLVNNVFTDMAEQLCAKVRSSKCEAGTVTTENTKEVMVNNELVQITLLQQ